MNPNQKQILFLTSTNLACNPRCLKEVRLMNDTNAQVTVVGFHLNNWTDEKEKDLRKELDRVGFYYLEAGRKPFFAWFQSTFLEKLSRLLQPLLPHSAFLAALAIDKRSYLLYEWIKSSKHRYDLIIAHNPPAFYAAAALAEKSRTPFALDIEDYHPGEGHKKIVRDSSAYLMRRFLKRTAYASYASPLIKKYAVQNVNDGDDRDALVINNTFPASEFISEGSEGPVSEKLQIVWFSQIIDYGRGLEKVLPWLDQFRDRIGLTLIGSMREGFFGREIKNREYIDCRGALAQIQLHQSLGAFDIGLALEDGTVDSNRNLCLTNKIWSYYLAGLYIVASDTKAQQLFLKARPQHGGCTTLSGDSFGKLMGDLIENLQSIRDGRKERLQAASAESWESESLLLKGKWAEILS